MTSQQFPGQMGGFSAPGNSEPDLSQFLAGVSQHLHKMGVQGVMGINHGSMRGNRDIAEKMAAHMIGEMSSGGVSLNQLMEDKPFGPANHQQQQQEVVMHAQPLHPQQHGAYNPMVAGHNPAINPGLNPVMQNYRQQQQFQQAQIETKPKTKPKKMSMDSAKSAECNPYSSYPSLDDSGVLLPASDIDLSLEKHSRSNSVMLADLANLSHSSIKPSPQSSPCHGALMNNSGVMTAQSGCSAQSPGALYNARSPGACSMKSGGTRLPGSAGPSALPFMSPPHSSDSLPQPHPSDPLLSSSVLCQPCPDTHDSCQFNPSNSTNNSEMFHMNGPSVGFPASGVLSTADRAEGLKHLDTSLGYQEGVPPQHPALVFSPASYCSGKVERRKGI